MQPGSVSAWWQRWPADQVVEVSSGLSELPLREQFVFSAGSPLIPVDSRVKLPRENKHAGTKPMNLLHLFLVFNLNLSQHGTTLVGVRGSETHTSTLLSINVKGGAKTLLKDL